MKKHYAEITQNFPTRIATHSSYYIQYTHTTEYAMVRILRSRYNDLYHYVSFIYKKQGPVIPLSAV